MFGAVAGAILGPLVFAPIFKGRQLSAPALAVPWLIGGAMLLVASLLFSTSGPIQNESPR